MFPPPTPFLFFLLGLERGSFDLYLPESKTEDESQRNLSRGLHLEAPQHGHREEDDGEINNQVDDGSRKVISRYVCARAAHEVLVPVEFNGTADGEGRHNGGNAVTDCHAAEHHSGPKQLAIWERLGVEVQDRQLHKGVGGRPEDGGYNDRLSRVGLLGLGLL